MKTDCELINDSQRLVGASTHDGRVTIPIYDDGSGPLWILRDSIGIQGIVRCETWENAYSIAEDEFFDDCELTMEEIVEEYGFRVEYVQPYGSGQTSREEIPDSEAWPENDLFCEAYGFRPNGLRDASKPMSFIYAKDLNGEALDALTPSLVAELGITLNIENW